MVSLAGDKKDYQSVGLGLVMGNADEWRLFHAFIVHLSEVRGKASEEANFAAFQKAMHDVYGDTPPKNIQEIGIRTVQAVNMIPQLPWPVIPMLVDYDHVYYTGLQLAQDPGMNVVWIGSAILVIGLCIMFYMPHRKLWFVIRQDGEKTEVTFAGMTNRNQIAFKETFNDLFTKLDEEFTRS